MGSRARSAVLAAVLGVLGVVVVCGEDGTSASLLRVPVAHATIQAAVDAAAPGDLVLIAPGTYHARVEVSTPNITIRGEDRNAVVLDNDDPRAPAIGAGFSGAGTRNTMLRNRVEGHDGFGIGLIDLNDFDPAENRVEQDTLRGNTPDLYFEVRVGETARATTRRARARSWPACATTARERSSSRLPTASRRPPRLPSCTTWWSAHRRAEPTTPA